MTPPELIGGFEKHVLPNGAEVFFSPARHTYFREIVEKKDGSWSGKDRLPGASTASKPLDYRPDNLMRWAARTNCEGVALLIGEAPESLEWARDGDSIWDALNEAELTYTHLRDKRATEGTNVHERVLSALAAGGAVPSLSSVSAEERGYAQGVLAWWRDRDPEPIAVEQAVFSDLYDYAGRFDLLATIDGEIVLCDLKTSGFISNGHHAQLAAYRIASVESGFPAPDRSLILKVTAEGAYEEIDCAATDEDWLASLGAYRAAAEVGKKARAARKLVAA